MDLIQNICGMVVTFNHYKIYFKYGSRRGYGNSWNVRLKIVEILIEWKNARKTNFIIILFRSINMSIFLKNIHAILRTRRSRLKKKLPKKYCDVCVNGYVTHGMMGHLVNLHDDIPNNFFLSIQSVLFILSSIFLKLNPRNLFPKLCDS